MRISMRSNGFSVPGTPSSPPGTGVGSARNAPNTWAYSPFNSPSAKVILKGPVGWFTTLPNVVVPLDNSSSQRHAAGSAPAGIAGQSAKSNVGSGAGSAAAVAAEPRSAVLTSAAAAALRNDLVM